MGGKSAAFFVLFFKFTLTVENVQGPCVKESRVGGLRPGTGDPGDFGMSGNFGAI